MGFAARLTRLGNGNDLSVLEGQIAIGERDHYPRKTGEAGARWLSAHH